jgi:hypothetical protein
MRGAALVQQLVHRRTWFFETLILHGRPPQPFIKTREVQRIYKKSIYKNCKLKAVHRRKWLIHRCRMIRRVSSISLKILPLRRFRTFHAMAVATVASAEDRNRSPAIHQSPEHHPSRRRNPRPPELCSTRLGGGQHLPPRGR